MEEEDQAEEMSTLSPPLTSVTWKPTNEQLEEFVNGKGSMCVLCGFPSASRKALGNHFTRNHPETSISTIANDYKGGVRHCPGVNGENGEFGLNVCDQTFASLRLLENHLYNDHNDQNIFVVEETFFDMAHFVAWKDQVEAETTSQFYAETARHTVEANNAECVTYYCHRNKPACTAGRYSAKKKQKRGQCGISSATNPIFGNCPARMDVSIDLETGYVTVRAQLRHYGHAISEEYKRQSKERISFIVSMIRMGVGNCNIANAVANRQWTSPRDAIITPDQVNKVKRAKCSDILGRHHALVGPGDIRQLISMIEQLEMSDLEAMPPEVHHSLQATVASARASYHIVQQYLHQHPVDITEKHGQVVSRPQRDMFDNGKRKTVSSEQYSDEALIPLEKRTKRPFASRVSRFPPTT